MENGNNYIITNLEAIKKHAKSVNLIPQGNCEYCGRPLVYRGLMHPFARNTVLIWRAQPEQCQCPQSQAALQKKILAEEEKAREIAIIQHQENERRLMDNSGLPRRLQQYEMSDLSVTEHNAEAVRTTKEYIINLRQNLKNGVGMCFVGGCGVGKTHLAVCIAKAAIQNEIFALYQNISGLYRELQKTFSTPGMSEEDIINKYSSVPLLILDDVGKELPSDWKLSTLYELINRRTDDMRPTIYTTNYTNLELKNRLKKGGDDSTATATVDRMMDIKINKVVVVEGTSWRGKYKPMQNR